MGYKIRRYSNFKRRFIFETYEPQARMRLNKEQTVPILIRIGHHFSSLGGWVSLLFSGIVLSLKGIFGIKRQFDQCGKMVEFRIKK